MKTFCIVLLLLSTAQPFLYKEMRRALVADDQLVRAPEPKTAPAANGGFRLN